MTRNKQEQPPYPINRLDWPLMPAKQETNVSTWHVWASQCGRYEVIRSISKLNEGEDYYAAVRINPENPKKKAIIRNNMRSLNAALLCSEHDLQEKLSQDVESNDMSTIEAAEKLGLSSLSQIPKEKRATAVDKTTNVPHNSSSGSTNLQNEGESILNIKESEARKLLAAVGMEATEKCNVKRLATKLNQLPLVSAELKSPEDSADKSLLQSVLDALQEGEKISVVPDSDEGQQEQTQKESPEVKTITKATKKGGKIHSEPKANVKKDGKTKPGKGAKFSEKPAKTSGKNKAAKKESTAETDKFGSRVGSGLAAINSCISSKSKSIAQLAEEAGRDNTMFRKHMKKLVEAGYVVKDENGYKLAKK